VQGKLPPRSRRSVPVLRYADEIQFKSVDDCNQYYLNDRRARAGDILRSQGKSEAQIRAALDSWYPPSRELISTNMLCAGTNDGAKDACFGDSGGPLVVSRAGAKVEAGIVSWGPGDGCGLTNLYGVYARVDRYLDWIRAQTH